MPNKVKKGREPEGTVLTSGEIANLRARGVGFEKVWTPNAAQNSVLMRNEDEILYAGGKYGGKTELGIFWLVSGNPSKADRSASGKPLLHNRSYIYHPKFLGAVIRLNEKDLAEWVDRARPHYEGTLGGTFTKNPSEFRWTSGARVFLGHAQDNNAWTKYQGQNITRFLIEEAGQIPDLETFDMLRSCCRSHWKEMRAQILLTANPGGPGQPWLFDRFIEPKDRDGVPVPHPTLGRPISTEDKGMIPISETVQHPFDPTKTITKTRIWVPSYITDNQYAMQDTAYIGTLATMRNEKMKKAYLYGDWRAFKGTYFDNFTVATHTFDPAQRPLASWWKATASLDWGFKHESAAYWHKQDPETKQHLIYKEFVTSGTDPVELGAELARQSMNEIRTQGVITFHVSHDLYHNRIGDFTWVELIQKGAERVIGKDTCYVPEVIIRELQERYRIEGREWTEDLEQRILTKPIEGGIVFRRAPRSRAVSFMHVRTLMRTEPIARHDSTAGIDWKFAAELFEAGNEEQYSGYLRSFNRTAEILPELMISRACPRLIDALPKVIHSEEKPDEPADRHFLGLDSCFVAGTLVETADGPKPIESIRVGQMVHTRHGLRSVKAAGQTGIEAVAELQLADGARLIGTPNHPVWTDERGFTRLDSLTYCDTLVKWKNRRESSASTESTISDAPRKSAASCEFTIGLQAKQESALDWQACIGTSGNRPTVQFQRAVISTTRTETRSTMTSPTWSVLHQRNTLSITHSPANDYSKCSDKVLREPVHGTLLQKGLRGIAKTGKGHGLGALRKWSLAACAGRRSPLFSNPEQSTAPIIVNRRDGVSPEKIGRVENASDAVLTSPAIDTSPPSFAPVRVLSVSALKQKQPVYNLQVEGIPEFFANGILVHNCDSLIYLMAGIRDEKPTPMPRRLAQLQYAEEAQRRMPNLDARDMIHIMREYEERTEGAEDQGFSLRRRSRE